MPQKTDNIIDVNQITNDLLSSQSLPAFAEQFDPLMNAFMRRSPVSDQYMGVKDEENAKNSIDYYKRRGQDAEAHLIETEYKIYSDLYGDYAREFFKYWNFIGGIFPKGYSNNIDNQSLMLVLNKLNVFDEETQLKLLKYIRYRVNIKDKEVSQGVLIKIANNKYATPYDKADAARETQNRDIIRDTIESLKVALNEEMSQDFPNKDTVQNLCNTALGVANSMHDKLDKQYRASGKYYKAPESDPEMQYILSIRKEFDINNIMNIGADYIPQLKQSLEERVIQSETRAENAEAEVQNIQQRMQQNNETMQQQNQQLTQNVETEKKKNKDLADQLDELQKQLAEYEKWVKTAKLKAATLKAGLFNGGAIKEFQDFLSRGPQVPER